MKGKESSCHWLKYIYPSMLITGVTYSTHTHIYMSMSIPELWEYIFCHYKSKFDFLCNFFSAFFWESKKLNYPLMHCFLVYCNKSRKASTEPTSSNTAPATLESSSSNPAPASLGPSCSFWSALHTCSPLLIWWLLLPPKNKLQKEIPSKEPAQGGIKISF